MRSITLAIAALALAGCSQQGVHIVKKGDVSFEILNFSGEWEEVALIYGYYDDMEGCEDIKEALENKYGRTYRCRSLD